ncbi:MAG: hypothetical protein ACRDRK_15570 [Pseudonocardia sp.]
MLQKPPAGLATAIVPIPEKARLLLWSLAIADVMTVAWMLSAGEWLDRASPVTAVITLGGHHLVVLWLAVAGFTALALLTALTGALTAVRPIHVPFLVVGALVSAVAVGGTISVILLFVGVVVLTALVGTVLVGGRFVFLGGSLRRR